MTAIFSNLGQLRIITPSSDNADTINEINQVKWRGFF